MCWWLIMPFHWLSFHQWVTMMNPGFVIDDYSWLEASPSFSLQWRSVEQIFVQVCSVCMMGEHFHHPPCANCSSAWFSDDAHNHLFSIRYCSAQFACHYAVVIPLQFINLIFSLLRYSCVERTWLNGTPVILVELDTVTIWWVRQETVWHPI
jgi:hypothetical protein